MKYFKSVVSIVFILGITGCATKNTYTYDGVQYNSIEALKEGKKLSQANDLVKIVALPQPISSKQLVVAEPSRELKIKRIRATVEKNLGRPTTDAEHNNWLNRPITEIQLEPTDIPNLVTKKGIYKSVDVVTFDTEVEIPASSERDIIQLEKNQWVFRGHKTGRQLLTFDNSKNTRVEGIEGMLNQIISAALLNK